MVPSIALNNNCPSNQIGLNEGVEQPSDEGESVLDHNHKPPIAELVASKRDGILQQSAEES